MPVEPMPTASRVIYNLKLLPTLQMKYSDIAVGKKYEIILKSENFQDMIVEATLIKNGKITQKDKGHNAKKWNRAIFKVLSPEYIKSCSSINDNEYYVAGYADEEDIIKEIK